MVPRYKYKLFNLGNYTSLTTAENRAQEIEIVFEDKNTSISTGSEVGKYLTHPAFVAFDTNGIWVAKFKPNYSLNLIRSIPNVTPTSASNLYNRFLNSYNFDRDKDSHMIKNTEWGAMAYLSHSKYGINGPVGLNNSSVTGRGANGAYNTNFYEPQTTTGNVYGIYDTTTSNDAYEETASYTGLNSSGFTTITIANYDSKYFNIYPANNTNVSYNTRILGDATGELGPFGSGAKSSWYNSKTYMIPTNYWYLRGGGGSIFSSSYTMGDSQKLLYRIVLAN